MQVQLTGFEPWEDLQINPSGVVSYCLGGHVLPVDEVHSLAQLALVMEAKPQRLLMLGLKPGAEKFYIETSAGNNYQGEKIDSGPDILSTELNTDKLLSLGQAELSEDAGNFICNLTYRWVLRETSVPVIFIHLPEPEIVPLEEQINWVSDCRLWLLDN
jgi:pyrrolidone-carboxylate peptidase